MGRDGATPTTIDVKKFEVGGSPFLSAAAENPKEPEEHIDEVQIKHQRSEDRQLLRGVCHVLMDRFEPLRVIRRQPDEDRHARVR